MSVNLANLEVIRSSPRIAQVFHDEESNLSVYHYVDCKKDDSELHKNCRGLIFDGETLILRGFPYTAEYNSTQQDELSQILTPLSEWRFYDSYEGTVLRAFYHGEKWRLATHRKLNAFESKWGCNLSFGDLFVIALQAEAKHNPDFKRVVKQDNILTSFYSTLDPALQYIFFVCNTEENRIVCDALPRPTAFHIATYRNLELDLDEKCLLPKPVERHFRDLNDLLTYVQKIPRTLQGLVCLGSENRQIKILHPKYQKFFHVRGNEPNILFRYLQVRNNPELRSCLYELYPSHAPDFQRYEYIFTVTVQRLLRLYKAKFIRKQEIPLIPAYEYTLIKKSHSWYTSQENNPRYRVTFRIMMNILNNMLPVELNKIVQNFSEENTVE